MAAYYNEIDPSAAQTLRNLIAAGHIAPGDVDTRDIRDVRPDDIKHYTQCHFFAGYGVWSYALRRAGWDDNRRVWTGSCPCQPFSAAGAGLGFADERHLWPYWLWLIEQCGPADVLGEQVASKDANPWLDLVSSDLEGLGFAFGALAFPSAGVGAPHIRDRTYFVAHADDARSQGWIGMRERAIERAARSSRLACGLADANIVTGGQGGAIDGGRHQGGDAQSRTGSGGNVMPCELADAGSPRIRDSRCAADAGAATGMQSEGVQRQRLRDDFGNGDRHADARDNAGPTNGFWRDADWLLCRDAKWRPVEPGTFPLAHGATNRVGRLRGYGNAINAEAARTFIECAEAAICEYELL